MMNNKLFRVSEYDVTTGKTDKKQVEFVYFLHFDNADQHAIDKLKIDHFIRCNESILIERIK